MRTWGAECTTWCDPQPTYLLNRRVRSSECVQVVAAGSQRVKPRDLDDVAGRVGVDMDALVGWRPLTAALKALGAACEIHSMAPVTNPVPWLCIPRRSTQLPALGVRHVQSGSLHRPVTTSGTGHELARSAHRHKFHKAKAAKGAADAVMHKANTAYPRHPWCGM